MENQLMIATNFMPFKDNDQEHMVHSKSNSVIIIINDKADEIIKEIFQSHLSRYQIRLETSIKVSDFISDCVHLLYYSMK